MLAALAKEAAKKGKGGRRRGGKTAEPGVKLSPGATLSPTSRETSARVYVPQNVTFSYAGKTIKIR